MGLFPKYSGLRTITGGGGGGARGGQRDGTNSGSIFHNLVRDRLVILE